MELLAGFLFLVILVYLSFDFFHKQAPVMQQTSDESLFGEMSLNIFDSKSPYETDSKYDIEFRKLLNKNSIYPKPEIFEKYYNKIGPVKMVKIIDESQFCHTQGHGLGRVIFNRTKDLKKSMDICQGHCTMGCFHGVLMGFFKEILPKGSYEEGDDQHIINFSSNISKILTEFCDKPEVSKFVVKGNCYHAIGHAILFVTNYDLQSALKYCKSFDGINEVYYCHTGVFMEYDIITKGKTPNESSFYPCDYYTEFPAACYRYKMRRLINKSEPPMKYADFCMGLNSSQRLGCFHGLGFALIDKIFKNPGDINNICVFGTKQDQMMCLDGIAQVASVFNRSAAVMMCRSLLTDLKGYCYNETELRAYNMKKSLKLYLNESDLSKTTNQ